MGVKNLSQIDVRATARYRAAALKDWKFKQLQTIIKGQS
jgi:hypothetical protein